MHTPAVLTESPNLSYRNVRRGQNASRFEVFAFISGARYEWLGCVCQCQTIVEWLITQLWTQMAMSFVV